MRATSHEISARRPATLTLYIASRSHKCDGVADALRVFLDRYASSRRRVRVRDLSKQPPYPEDHGIEEKVAPCIVLRDDGRTSQLILGNLRNTDALSLTLADRDIRPFNL